MVKLPFVTDDGCAGAGAFGIIILQNDETLESEFRRVFDHPDRALYHARIPSGAEVTPETLQQMELDLPRAAALLPATAQLDVVAYACTSGATVIGSSRIAEIVKSSHPRAKVTDPIQAVIAACQHLAVTRIGLISPYIAQVSDAMRALLEKNGLSVPAFASFEQSEEAVVARISQQSVLEAICQMGASEEIDAVFASCTNLRSFDILDDAETAIGKPVITSNQALAWHMQSLAPSCIPSNGPGELFRR